MLRLGGWTILQCFFVYVSHEKNIACLMLSCPITTYFHISLGSTYYANNVCCIHYCLVFIVNDKDNILYAQSHILFIISLVCFSSYMLQVGFSDILDKVYVTVLVWFWCMVSEPRYSISIAEVRIFGPLPLAER